MIQVVAAVIEREGRILIGQRQPGQSHALLWEFPGGKVEPGELPDQALTRELEEELAIRNARGEEILRYDYQYPGKPSIMLIFFRVTSYEGDPQNLIYREMRWEPRTRLAAFDFVAGDRDFLQKFCS
ncbi:MAG: (deoxy)nucleoside triphosphate pyrophosphohydrolase [Bryobacteraceae bacterium]|jgi:8-oxo-dGTP diphosphatase